jgi:hypothetical protein
MVAYSPAKQICQGAGPAAAGPKHRHFHSGRNLLCARHQRCHQKALRSTEQHQQLSIKQASKQTSWQWVQKHHSARN